MSEGKLKSLGLRQSASVLVEGLEGLLNSYNVYNHGVALVDEEWLRELLDHAKKLKKVWVEP